MFVTVFQQDIREKEVSDINPSRVKKAARLNVNCLQNNEDDEKNKILALVLAALVDFHEHMSNHVYVYKVRDTIQEPFRNQESGTGLRVLGHLP